MTNQRKYSSTYEAKVRFAINLDDYQKDWEESLEEGGFQICRFVDGVFGNNGSDCKILSLKDTKESWHYEVPTNGWDKYWFLSPEHIDLWIQQGRMNAGSRDHVLEIFNRRLKRGEV